jgi:succinate-acetate transporter protein
MEWRGVTITNVYIGNFFFGMLAFQLPFPSLTNLLVAGIGMVISAQWELVLGNSFGYTALSAFGLSTFCHPLLNLIDHCKGFFYGGFGAIITPIFGVTEAYGTDTSEYNNALGFFVLMWTVLNTFFLLGSLAMYISPPL